MSITKPLPENDRNATLTETLEGYVADVACLRKYPRNELVERVRRHTYDCLTMGHCMESGYGLVDDHGRIALLDAAATPLVLDAARSSGGERGIRLRAEREMEGKEMKTRRVLFVAAEKSGKIQGDLMEERVPPYAG